VFNLAVCTVYLKEDKSAVPRNLTEVLDGEDWLAALSDRFTPLEINYALPRKLGWFRRMCLLCGEISKSPSYRRWDSDLTDRQSEGLVTV
jgi:hypothetical protein